MNEEKLKYVEYIKNMYFSKPFIATECEQELIKPKFKDLLFGFINGSKKTMFIYDKESNIRLEY
jgi:hypothetical protein